MHHPSGKSAQYNPVEGGSGVSTFPSEKSAQYNPGWGEGGIHTHDQLVQ